ncbi:MAG: GC-type dockerin domain-anchored protein [Phycisphaerales bacterium]
MKRVAACLLVAGIAGSASAQCNIFRNGIPDFDQRRSALPNNGGMYCVPTSAINQMAYIANHGVPGLLSGPRNWQSQTNYSYVSSQIAFMGGLMGTDPFDGTYGNPGENGLRTFVQTRAPGKFTIIHYYGDYTISPLFFHTILGRLVNVCYGYYPVSNNRYYRDGGHCVSLTGLIDYCSDDYRLRMRNPADDSDNLATQSAFSSLYSDASSQFFVDTNGNIHNRIRLWDLGVNSTTRRYLDSYFVINPLVCLSGGLSNTEFTLHFPVQVFGLTPPSSNHTAPEPDTIVDVEFDPQQLNAYIVTSQIIPREQKVYRYELATGNMTELFAANTTLRVCTSRFGDVFIVGDGSVRKYYDRGGNFGLLQELPTTDSFDAIEYDDTRDELVGVTAAGRLVRLHADLTQGGFDEPLPGGVAPAGSTSLAIDEATQRYLICGSSAPTVWSCELIPGSPRLRIQASWLLPANPTSLRRTEDGSLVYIANNQMNEVVPSAAGGGWVPRAGSILSGLPAARTLALARSRSNLVQGVHDTPEWRNVLVNDETPSVPDCVADFNNDGIVNSQDFFDFVTAFFAGAAESDINYDGQRNSQDFFDFLTAFFAGC